MASIGDNSLWSDLDSASTDIMGPSYSYADNIQGPSSMGVGSNGSMSQIVTNTGAIINYVKYMISGPAMGNQYFVNTGGSCIAPDKSTQSRYNYINNIANGADLVPAAMRSDLSGLTSDFNGLIPGVLEDVEGLNPIGLFKSLAADSTPTCECYTCPSGNSTESRFLNTTLSPDYDSTLCQQETDLTKCAGTNTESFSNQNDSLPTLIALGLLLVINVF
jgi:hypothetical protein